MCDMSSRPSTWYEEERSRILYACEEKYDGNMVAYVIELESQLIGLKLEHEAMLNDIKNIAVTCDICKYSNIFTPMCDEADCDCVACRYTEECKCLSCTSTNNNFEWRGIQDKKVKLKPMTLENVKPGEVLFIEFFNQPDIERVEIVEGFAPNLVGYYEEFSRSGRHNVDEISYGQYWRCWESRPTEEEREAAPWIQKGSERA